MKNPRVPPELLARARELRKNLTPAEAKLWVVIREWRNSGLIFRRQHPISPYIVDFVCLKARLVVEIDGRSHAGREKYDLKRQSILESLGWKVLRFDETEILNRTIQSSQIIYDSAMSPPEPILAKGGREGLSERHIQEQSATSLPPGEGLREGNNREQRAISLPLGEGLREGHIQEQSAISLPPGEGLREGPKTTNTSTSKELDSLLAHPAITKIRELTQNTPYENNLHIVGGAVRDALLNRLPKNDLDLVTELDAQLLAKSLDKKAQIYPRFGTAMVRIARTNIELVTARKESYDATSRKPNTEPASLLEDAGRRDFTVNTLLLNIHTGELTDPLGTGIHDLQNQILRTPLDPAQTFHDDPLRMLRAVRFKHQLGFEYHVELLSALKEESHRLSIISQERIRDEFSKILLGSNPEIALRELLDFGLLHTWAPELEAMVGVEQGKWHYADVWTHTLHVVKNATIPPLRFNGEGDQGGEESQTTQSEQERLTLLLSALLHDIAKPLTRTIDEKGDTRFFNHENLGEELALDLCIRWRYSQDTARNVSLLVKNHMRLSGIKKLSTPATRRIIRDLGDQLDNWIALIEADAGALKSGVRKLDLTELKAKISEVKTTQPVSNWASPLTGEQIMEITGLPPGPEIGKLKSELENLVIEGTIPANDIKMAKDALQNIIRNRL